MIAPCRLWIDEKNKVRDVPVSGFLIAAHKGERIAPHIVRRYSLETDSDGNIRTKKNVKKIPNKMVKMVENK